ncbi:MAG TPA: DUF3108 domain-containing protein [Nitrospira sp.]|nr:DUF3108 domain-containing protein [Nitrospira sp.]
MSCRRNEFVSARSIILFLSTCLFCSLFSDASLSDQIPESRPADPPPLPFSVGERLSYDVTWLNLRAGIATMAVQDQEPHEGRPQILLNFVARSSPVVTKFYSVENRAASTMDVQSFLPRHMTFARREGKRSNDFDYTFRHSEGLVTAVKDGKPTELPIPVDAQDAISCLYYVRKALPMVPGASLAMNVHHDNKNYKLEVRVEGLETLKGSWGKRQTARVLVIMPFQGIFLNEGNIRVWFTTDDRRVPVRMKAKVIVGSIVADLTEGYGTGGS